MSEVNGQDVLNPRVIDKHFIASVREAYRAKGGLSAAFGVASRVNGWSPVTVTYVSDNGGNTADAAKGEIEKRILDINAILSTVSGIVPPQRLYHDIPSQDWIAGAFDLAQLARDTVRGAGNIIFVNCAPRLKQRGKEGDNQGEQVYIGVLPNGTVVSGVGEASFAFFRDLIERDEMEIYRVNVQTNGSQFRSRDFFPWFAQAVAFRLSAAHQGWQENLSVDQRRALISRLNFVDVTTRLSAQNIPDLQTGPVVARADVHGNLKLSISKSDIPDEWIGQRLKISITGRAPFTAVLRENMFDNGSPDRGIAPGSSGDWKDSAKPNPRFLELALMGRSARADLSITDEELRNGLHVEISLPAAQDLAETSGSVEEEIGRLDDHAHSVAAPVTAEINA
jgi:hypothetical protein